MATRGVIAPRSLPDDNPTVRTLGAPLALAIAIVAVGCSDTKPEATSRPSPKATREAVALVAASERFSQAAGPITRTTAARLDRSFNTCPMVALIRANLPSESQLEPFDRTHYYRVWSRPYAAYARSLHSLRLNDSRLRPAGRAMSKMQRYLRQFRNAHGTVCGLLRAWQASGFDHQFDIASYAGVAKTEPSTRELRATRATLAAVAVRLRQLGVSSRRARLFLVASDPFR